MILALCIGYANPLSELKDLMATAKSVYKSCQCRLTSTDVNAYYDRSKHVDRLEVNAYFGRSKTTSLKNFMTLCS